MVSIQQGAVTLTALLRPGPALVQTRLLGQAVTAATAARVCVIHVSVQRTRLHGHVVTVTATLHMLLHHDTGTFLLTFARGYTTPSV